MSIDELTPAVLAKRLRQAADAIEASPDLRQRVEARRRLRRRHTRMGVSLAASVLVAAAALSAVVAMNTGHHSPLQVQGNSYRDLTQPTDTVTEQQAIRFVASQPGVTAVYLKRVSVREMIADSPYGQDFDSVATQPTDPNGMSAGTPAAFPAYTLNDWFWVIILRGKLPGPGDAGPEVLYPWEIITMPTHPPLNRGPEDAYDTTSSQATLPGWFVKLTSQPATTVTGEIPASAWQSQSTKA